MSSLQCKKCGGKHLTIKCGKNKYNNNNSKYNNNNNKFNDKRYKKFCVKMSNIPNDLYEFELRKLLKGWGEISKINFNNKVEYYAAYIDFYNKDQAEYFVKALDKTPFDNRILDVELLKK